MVLRVELQRDAQLTKIAFALSSAGLLFGVSQGRQKQTGETRNDRDDDQQLQERESDLNFRFPRNDTF